MSEQKKFKPMAERMAEEKQRDTESRKRERLAARAMAENIVANLDAAEAERERVRLATEQATHEQTLQESLKASYIAANGSEFGFTDAYPRLRAAWVEAQTLANVAPKAISSLDVARKTLKQCYTVDGGIY